MKKIINLFITGAIMLLTVTVSCHKSDVKKNGCGCNSDSIWHYVAYDNLGGYKYNALLNYNTDNNQNAWFNWSTYS